MWRNQEEAMHDDHSASANPSLPRIKLPDFPPVTPEEIERRRALVARIRERRERIGPIGIPADELIHQVRAEADGLDE
jgi:hypothetical protein